jgi:PAS domain S-box-containing protein
MRKMPAKTIFPGKSTIPANGLPDPLAEKLEPRAKALHESLEAAPYGILVYDEHGRILVFNSQLEQITGYRRTEIPELKTWIETIFPDAAFRKRILDDRRENPPGKLRIREAAISCRDGTTCTCQFASFTSKSGIHTVFVQDIQRNKKMLQTLLESEEKYKALYRSNPTPTLTWIRTEGDFILVSYNSAAEVLTGGEIVGELGKSASEIFNERPDILSNLERCFGEKIRFTEETFFNLPNSAAASQYQLTYAFAAPEFVFVHVEDITRLRQTERELAQSEKRFEELVNLLPETVFEFDLDGRFVYANRAGFEKFGFTAQDLENGTHMLDLVVPQEREKALQNMTRALEGGPIGLNEYTLIRKDGSTFPALLRSSLIIQDGRPAGVRGFLIDITERKELERKILEARDELEARVKQRTQELEIANRILLREIAERRQVEEALRSREKELQEKAEELREINTALRVILKKSAADKEELEDKMMINVKDLIMPLVEKIKQEELSGRQRAHVSAVENNLREIVSPMTRELTRTYQPLTPAELQVANFIKQGRTSKEIAEILNLSSRTIESHRKNIRGKLGLKHQRANLRTHLLSIDRE